VRFGFTRNVVGPMDYTPLTFAAAYDEVGTTYAHQLALSVIIESGIQHFADRADSSPDKGFRKLFTDYPFTQDFLTRIPANWDDTLFLKGHPDSHIVIARKSGDTWYVAGINGTSSELPITIQPDFLTDDTLRIETITDGDSPDSLDFESNQQTASEPISLLLPARGGFLITYLPL
jgi:alpha-glucosidase